MVSDSEKSDFTAINSGDEFPTDSIGDVLVVSTKGVLKEIIKCGDGYNKPGIGDEIVFDYYCVKENGSESEVKNSYKRVTTILGDTIMVNNGILCDNSIPWGLELALRQMLKGEVSKVLIKKDSIFSHQRRIDETSSEKNIIPSESYKNNYVRSKKLVNLLKNNIKDFIAYHVKLVDFCYIESINDNIKKKILKEGVRLKSPSRNDMVEISISTNIDMCIQMNFNEIETKNLKRMKVNLKKMKENRELNDCLSPIMNLISQQDFIELMLSMKVGEVSQVRIKLNNNCKDCDYSINKINSELYKYIVIHLHGYYWERRIQFKYPFENEINNNDSVLVLSSYDKEDDFLNNGVQKNFNSIPKRISGIDLGYDSKLNIEMSEFKLISNSSSTEYDIDIPIRGINNNEYNLKSINLRISPGHYTTPLWLESSLPHCYLGGKYTLNVPYPLIFFFPPDNECLGSLDLDGKSEILSKIKLLLYNKKHEYEEAYWDLKLLLDYFDGIRKIESEESNLNNSFSLKLNFKVKDRNVNEKFTPFCLGKAEKYFYYYYYMALKMNSYIDYKYMKSWSIISLEYLDKLFYILKLLPQYSKINWCENYDKRTVSVKKINLNNKINSRKQDYENKETVNNIHNYEHIFFQEYTRSDLEVKNDNIENITPSLTEFEDKNELKIITHSVKMAHEISFKLKKYEKCINYYQNYKILSLYDLKNVIYVFISSVKIGNKYLIDEISDHIRTKLNGNESFIDTIYKSSSLNDDKLIEKAFELLGETLITTSIK
ncbi:hypothetical protein RS030_162471 [Cryptosporidium xiaoi]|uniref:Peptidylprolyl isomerase n=1 Tax=Cryptosporidium xiaoi TaxID=659607 RepID=A0AAV9XZR5_9CRYT